MKRPKITNVLASSVNGLIAGSSREADQQRKSYNLTNQEDQAHLASVMSTCDAIITGANSLRSEEGLRTENGLHGHPPTWIIFTTEGIDKNHAFWSQSKIKRVLVSPEPVDCFDQGVLNLVSGEKSAVEVCVGWLTENKYEHALIFGGGVINHMFYAKKQINELILTVSPILFQSQTAVNILPNEIDVVKMDLLSFKKDVSHNIYAHYKIRNSNYS